MMMGASGLGINKQLRRLSARDPREVASPSPLESPSSSSCASGPTTATSPLLLGCCRVCRKNIEVGEKHHYCDTCSQPVCEDCSSYYSPTDASGEPEVSLFSHLAPPSSLISASPPPSFFFIPVYLSPKLDYLRGARTYASLTTRATSSLFSSFHWKLGNEIVVLSY